MEKQLHLVQIGEINAADDSEMAENKRIRPKSRSTHIYFNRTQYIGSDSYVNGKLSS